MHHFTELLDPSEGLVSNPHAFFLKVAKLNLFPTKKVSRSAQTKYLFVFKIPVVT